MRPSVCDAQTQAAQSCPDGRRELTPHSPFPDKATDENLTSEDWGAIMEVCDRVSGDPSGPKDAVQSMIKRLAHRNANVQLYTLEVSSCLRRDPRHMRLLC